MATWSPIITPRSSSSGGTANHLLSVRAQRKNFQNQLRDRARMEIARAVHGYQGWLEGLGAGYLDAKYGIDRDEHWIETDLEGNREPIKYFRDIVQPSRAWIVRLEEYEMVFPETRTIRKDLELRQQRLSLSVIMKSMSAGDISLVADPFARPEAE